MTYVYLMIQGINKLWSHSPHDVECFTIDGNVSAHHWL
jgi:hypothetical protein